MFVAFVTSTKKEQFEKSHTGSRSIVRLMEATQLAFISKGKFHSYSVAISSFTIIIQSSSYALIPKTSFWPHL